MARTEGMEASHRNVVWKMTPEVARQVATLIEMCESDPFHLRHELATDLRHFANAAESQRQSGHTPNMRIVR